MTSRIAAANPGKVTRVLARPNLTHVGLQAEMLVHEIDAHRRRNDLTPRDIADLHTMVANCLLFLDPTGRGR